MNADTKTDHNELLARLVSVRRLWPLQRKENDVKLLCVLGFHLWWIKAMTPQEINECINYGSPWPPLTEICLRCHSERPT